MASFPMITKIVQSESRNKFIRLYRSAACFHP